MKLSSDLSISIPLRNFLFVDGPNVDAVLGKNVLERKPDPRERPRWDRVRDVARCFYSSTEETFVLNGDTFDDQRTPFYRALRAMGYRVETPCSADWCKSEGEDPVDELIKERSESLVESIRNGDHAGILICSHDGGFAPVLERILEIGGFVGVVGFREWFDSTLTDLKNSGALLLDLERDFGAFDVRLNRPVIVE